MKKGQSLTEYALALGLVGIAAIGSMVLLGNSVQLGMNSVFGGPSASTRPASPSGNPITATPTIALPAQFASLTGSSEQITLANGKTLNFTSLNPMEVLDVSGGNGLSEAALFQLQQIIKELKEKDPTNPVIAALEELARRGTNVSTLQQGVLAARGNRPPLPEEGLPIGFTQAEPQFVTLNGEQIPLANALTELNTIQNLTYASGPYQPGEEAAIVGQAQSEYLQNQIQDLENYGGIGGVQITNPFPGVEMGVQQMGNEDTKINNFLEQYSIAAATPSLQENPQLAQKIKELSSQIVISANTTSNQIPTEQLKSLVQTTTTSTANICNLSGSKDNCK